MDHEDDNNIFWTLRYSHAVGNKEILISDPIKQFFDQRLDLLIAYMQNDQEVFTNALKLLGSEHLCRFSQDKVAKLEEYANADKKKYPMPSYL